MLRLDVKYQAGSVPIGSRLAHPRAVIGAVIATLWLVLFAAYGVRWIAGNVIAVGAVISVRAWRNRPLPLPAVEPEYTPADWLADLCHNARVPAPLVLGDRATKDGHEWDVVITGWCERDGRPMPAT